MQRKLKKLGILRADREARLLEVLPVPGCFRNRLRFCAVFVPQDRECNFAVGSVKLALRLEVSSQMRAVNR